MFFRGVFSEFRSCVEHPNFSFLRLAESSGVPLQKVFKLPNWNYAAWRDDFGKAPHPLLVPRHAPPAASPVTPPALGHPFIRTMVITAAQNPQLQRIMQAIRRHDQHFVLRLSRKASDGRPAFSPSEEQRKTRIRTESQHTIFVPASVSRTPCCPHLPCAERVGPFPGFRDYPARAREEVP